VNNTGTKKGKIMK